MLQTGYDSNSIKISTIILLRNVLTSKSRSFKNNNQDLENKILKDTNGKITHNVKKHGKSQNWDSRKQEMKI